jgi:hypothetical protein
MSAATPEPNPSNETIADALRVFMRPGQVTEVRLVGVIDSPKYPSFTMTGFYDYEHLYHLGCEILNWRSKAEGCYFVFNSVDRELLALSANQMQRSRSKGGEGEGSSTKDENIIARNLILIDADPKRLSTTTGLKLPGKLSASGAEKELAFAKIGEVDSYLADMGFPEPILADSGNGFHAWHRCDIPLNHDHLVKDFLDALARKFDDDRVEIDKKVGNLSRVAKIYGSIARKGGNVPDRPHRFAKLLLVPSEQVPVDRGLLEKVIADCPAPTVVPMSPGPARLPRSGLRTTGRTGVTMSAVDRARACAFGMKP